MSLENITNILEVSLTVHLTLVFQPFYSYKLTVSNFPHRKIICRGKYVPIYIYIDIDTDVDIANLNVFLINVLHYFTEMFRFFNSLGLNVDCFHFYFLTTSPH